MEAPKSGTSHGDSGMGYEVFLNFRGPDARDTIVDSLYVAMTRARIRVFKDDPGLQVGEEIGGNLLQAINDCRIYIPIFSEKYASSKWCLRELTHMVKCMRSSREEDKKVILPIFYKVDAADVKLNTELYQEALQKHEIDSGNGLVEKWKEALKVVARIKGRKLGDHGLGKLTNLVLEDVTSLLWRRQTDVLDRLVKIEDRKEVIMKLLDEKASDVRFVLIHGMGGIGKTTLAKAIFKQISPHFQGHCCFLSDIRTHDILYLQKKLLSDILNICCTNLSNIDEGTDMIKTKFQGKKVLIVLDDIDKKNQITRLAGEANCFGGGSRIIITTRDYSIEVAQDCGNSLTYEMPAMCFDDALQLFCHRAFGCAEPPPEYSNVSCQITATLGGLPLLLGFIGSIFRGKGPSVWINVLEKLQMIPREDVQQMLKISWETLDDVQKQIFLDIACVFINQEKKIAIKYWDAVLGKQSEIEVRILTNMSFIKITDDDKLSMHDQIRDLGRYINYHESREIHQKSRLLFPEDASHVMQRKEVTENILMLNLGTPEPDASYKFKPKEFVRLVNLRFLQLDQGNFIGDFKDCFSKLRWLSWDNCPSNFGATNFPSENLAVLELSGINITEDWGGWCQIMVAKQLKVLKLLDCPSLQKMPQLSTISGLETLILRGCTGLEMIDESIGNLQHLNYLEIECEAIESLPESIGNLTSLLELRVQSRRLSVLPHSIGNLVKVKHLILRCPKLRKLPDSIGQLESLLELDVQFSKIKKLPHSIGNLGRLEVLRIAYCKLKKLPDSIGRLQSLFELDLHESNIMGLPDCIENLANLRVVNLDNTFLYHHHKRGATLQSFLN